MGLELLGGSACPPLLTPVIVLTQLSQCSHLSFSMVHESQITTAFVHQLGSALASRDVTGDGIWFPGQGSLKFRTRTVQNQERCNVREAVLGSPEWEIREGFLEEVTGS